MLMLISALSFGRSYPIRNDSTIFVANGDTLGIYLQGDTIYIYATDSVYIPMLMGGSGGGGGGGDVSFTDTTSTIATKWNITKLDTGARVNWTDSISIIATKWDIEKLDTASRLNWIDTNSTIATQGWVNLQGFLTSFTESDPIWQADSNNYYRKTSISVVIGDSAQPLRQYAQDLRTYFDVTVCATGCDYTSISTALTSEPAKTSFFVANEVFYETLSMTFSDGDNVYFDNSTIVGVMAGAMFSVSGDSVRIKGNVKVEKSGAALNGAWALVVNGFNAVIENLLISSDDTITQVTELVTLTTRHSEINVVLDTGLVITQMNRVFWITGEQSVYNITASELDYTGASNIEILNVAGGGDLNTIQAMIINNTSSGAGNVTGVEFSSGSQYNTIRGVCYGNDTNLDDLGNNNRTNNLSGASYNFDGQVTMDTVTIDDDLTVNGQLAVGDTSSTGYNMPLTAGASGKILQADANGDAYWATNTGGALSFGTFGQIPYSNSAGDDFYYTNDLFYDSADVEIGVGTNTPTEKLHILGNLYMDGGGLYANVGASKSQVFLTSASYLYFGNAAGSANGIIFRTDGTAYQMFLEPSGDLMLSNVVRITPDAKFNVIGEGHAGTTDLILLEDDLQADMFTVNDTGRVDAKVIYADSIYTTKTGAWADYVFEKGYTLYELENELKFIKRNKHLRSLKPVL